MQTNTALCFALVTYAHGTADFVELRNRRGYASRSGTLDITGSTAIAAMFADGEAADALRAASDASYAFTTGVRLGVVGALLSL